LKHAYAFTNIIKAEGVPNGAMGFVRRTGAAEFRPFSAGEPLSMFDFTRIIDGVSSFHGRLPFAALKGFAGALAFFAAAFLFLPEPAQGVEPDGPVTGVSAGKDYPVSGESVMAKCGRKFVRGLTNVVTGSGEIPRQIIIACREDDTFMAAPVGFFSGVFMTVARTAYGAVEAGTFIAPLEGTYDSLLKPSYVWGPIEAKAVAKPARKEEAK